MSDLPNEEWRDVPGYEGKYRVSDMGRVWSNLSNRLLTPTAFKGYLRVGLHRDGKTKTYGVHRLVAWAFIGEQPDGTEVNHRDGQTANNTPGNLEYVTHAENMQHAVKVLGRKLGYGKLSPSKVIEIISLLNAGQMPCNAIAKRYGVDPVNISYILAGKIWGEYTHLLTPSAYNPQGGRGRPRIRPQSAPTDGDQS